MKLSGDVSVCYHMLPMILDIAWRILACFLIADFLSGLFHWLEDTFWAVETPILGKWVVHHNIVHHHDPRFFTRKSWFRCARSTLALGIIALALVWCRGWLNWMTALVIAIGVNANDIHKWSHRTRAENGWFIVLMQQLRILQTPAHHAAHHRAGNDTH